MYAALVHEDHAVTDLAGKAHFVRDHQQRHAFVNNLCVSLVPFLRQPWFLVKTEDQRAG